MSNCCEKMKAYKMKSRGLPKLKFKIMNRALKSELPLDLSVDKSNGIESNLFRPYIDCNSSYMIKSHQVRSTLASNQLMINDLMMKSLVAYSPFIYKMSSSLSLSCHGLPIYSSPNLELLHQSAKLPITPQNEPDAPSPAYSSTRSLANDLAASFAYQRSPSHSPSHSPTSTISSNLSSGLSVNSFTNSLNSVDFSYEPLGRPTVSQPMNLCTRERLSDSSLNKPKKISELARPNRQIKENEKLRKTSDDQILIKCPSCWQLFDQENSLRKHIKSKHQINENSAFDRIHKCEHCVLAFTRFDMLQRHNRKHSGEKPYECNLCYRNFSRSDHLNTHRINHFGLKPYICSLCPYASSRRDMVSRHLQTHSNGQATGAYVKTDLIAKQLCKKLVHSTPDQIPGLVNRFKAEC